MVELEDAVMLGSVMLRRLKGHIKQCSGGRWFWEPNCWTALPTS